MLNNFTWKGIIDMKLIKRNGAEAVFDSVKIFDAVQKANRAEGLSLIHI